MRKRSAVGSRLSAGARPRILAGRWKGRALQVPKGARPTSSRAREALFDVLQDSVGESRVLDLFAGSGAIGLEALSRGASHATFVERESGALERNLATLGVEAGEFDVFRVDARAAVSDLVRSGKRFELVFADPPYDEVSGLPKGLAALLTRYAWLVVQTDSRAAPPKVPGLVAAERRAYGRNVFWFLEQGRG